MQLSLHEILRKIRFDRGFSQENIAEELKVDSTTYGRYERGETPIKFEQVAQLADFYDMTLDQLYHYSDPTFVKPPDADKIFKLLITVELDGVDKTLKTIIRKLTAINQTLSESSIS